VWHETTGIERPGTSEDHSDPAARSEDSPVRRSSSIWRNSEAVNRHGMRQLLWHISQRYCARSIATLVDSPHPRSGWGAMPMPSARLDPCLTSRHFLLVGRSRDGLETGNAARQVARYPEANKWFDQLSESARWSL
jgi:hypothetical protein